MRTGDIEHVKVDDPIAHRLLEGIAGLGRLTVFDRRGIDGAWDLHEVVSE